MSAVCPLCGSVVIWGPIVVAPPVAPPAVVRGLVEALEDALGGWRYIRRQHGDLPGVGWDRVEEAATAALKAAKEAGV